MVRFFSLTFEAHLTKNNRRMYKKIVYLTLALSMMVSGYVCTSCDDTETYAELLDAEKAAIKSYIKKYNIVVLSTFPKDSIFKENEYYLDAQGLYIHIDSLGSKRKVQTGETVLLWFEKRGPLPKYDSIAACNYTSPKPDEFVYMGSYTSTRYAWYRPLKWVGNGGKVKVIAPHAAGNTTDQSNVEAYAYELEYILTKLDN